MTTVKMIKTAQTGAHYGKKGDTVEVPDQVAQEWIALGAAVAVAAKGTVKKA